MKIMWKCHRKTMMMIMWWKWKYINNEGQWILSKIVKKEKKMMKKEERNENVNRKMKIMNDWKWTKWKIMSRK